MGCGGACDDVGGGDDGRNDLQRDPDFLTFRQSSSYPHPCHCPCLLVENHICPLFVTLQLCDQIHPSVLNVLHCDLRPLSDFRLDQSPRTVEASPNARDLAVCGDGRGGDLCLGSLSRQHQLPSFNTKIFRGRQL